MRREPPLLPCRRDRRERALSPETVPHSVQAMREAADVYVAGFRRTGKSSLLGCLAGETFRAERPGTLGFVPWRLSAVADFGSVPPLPPRLMAGLRFVDTAGLPVLGRRHRSGARLGEAYLRSEMEALVDGIPPRSVVALCVDQSTDLEDMRALKSMLEARDCSCCWVLTKTDEWSPTLLSRTLGSTVATSAKRGVGCAALVRALHAARPVGCGQQLRQPHRAFKDLSGTRRPRPASSSSASSSGSSH